MRLLELREELAMLRDLLFIEFMSEFILELDPNIPFGLEKSWVPTSRI